LPFQCSAYAFWTSILLNSKTSWVIWTFWSSKDLASAVATADDTGDLRPVTGTANGIVKVDLKRSDKTTGVLDLKVQVGGTDKCRIRLGTSDLVVASTGGTVTLVSGYSINIVYTVHLYFSDSENLCKARLDADTVWSSTVPEQTDGNVSQLSIDFIGGATGTGFVDNIAVGSEPIETETPLALGNKTIILQFANTLFLAWIIFIISSCFTFWTWKKYSC